MTYDKKSAIWLALLWLAIILLSFLMEGCRSERVVTVPEHHYHVAHQRDTLIRTDSIYILDSVGTAMSGDTFYITRTRVEYRDRWRDRVRIDSFIQRDSIPYPVEVPTPLTRWQTWSMRTGNVVLRLLALSIGWGVLWLLGRLLLCHVFRR